MCGRTRQHPTIGQQHAHFAQQLRFRQIQFPANPIGLQRHKLKSSWLPDTPHPCDHPDAKWTIPVIQHFNSIKFCYFRNYWNFVADEFISEGSGF